MTSIDRRSFLAHSFAATGALGLPRWLAQALQPQDPVSDWREQQLRAAVATAKAHGKPLLVLVAPTEGELWEVGNWFGAWLTHGGSMALQELALCTIACASLAEVAKVTGAKGDAIAPLPAVAMLLVDVAAVGEVDAPAPKVTRIEPKLVPIDYSGGARGGAPDEVVAKQREQRQAGIELLTKELHDGMNRHGANLVGLAAAMRAKLTEAQLAVLATWVADGKLAGAAGAGADATLLVRATAEVRRAIADLPAEQRSLRSAALTEAITAEVVGKQLPGSRWRRPGGCGSEFETPTEEEKKSSGMLACGMGSVPPLCERFLTFYSVGS